MDSSHIQLEIWVDSHFPNGVEIYGSTLIYDQGQEGH